MKDIDVLLDGFEGAATLYGQLKMKGLPTVEIEKTLDEFKRQIKELTNTKE